MQSYFKQLSLPLLIVLLVLFNGILATPVLLALAVSLGILSMIRDSMEKIAEGKYSLDYIALLAMALALFTGEYLAGAVIALMYTGGEALEAFANQKARSALQKLSDTIPKVCEVLDKATKKITTVPIQEVVEGSTILVKRNEVLPLDGKLLTAAELTVANLTGESLPQNLPKGSLVKSGSVNVGPLLELKVVGDFSTSTYHKIVSLVDEAEQNPSKTVAFSEKANYFFSLLTLAIAATVFILTQDMSRVLAVLVVATPCPLIIAAPVAFVSGMSRAASRGVIIRKPSSLEDIATATTVYFDKTGTLTLGTPQLTKITVSDEYAKQFSPEEVLQIAANIEIHSLHPLARVVVGEAKSRGLAITPADNSSEKLGQGISGEVSGTRFSLRAATNSKIGLAVSLYAGSQVQDSQKIADLFFHDQVKEGVVSFLRTLQIRGVELAVITGDSLQNAQKALAGVFSQLPLQIFADQSPDGKYGLIQKARTEGKKVVMIGDGLNDAPALALAQVGIVYSGSENAASIQAADVAILGSGIDTLEHLFATASKTMKIAYQSIGGGIALSTIAMLFAAFGFIKPVTGAFIQELIDVVVILNALRALR